ncbi:MAG: TrmH family RNA methyltransferase [Lachnospiraceae bacterium]|nr:TrmH family RNA methyltransferase [Lachnospiraceae bacterium]
MEIKSYKKDHEYSYSLGAFPTVELLKTRPETVKQVILHSTFTDAENIKKLSAPHGIEVIVNDKLIQKLSDKENCFCIGVFSKYEDKLRNDRPHICLVNPGNMGNLGTIIRTAIGFGIKDMAIISPGADVFNPKTVRASMGAVFRMNIRYFDSFEDYEKDFPEHEIFCFMLNANHTLEVGKTEHSPLYTLVFGNEATGLPDSFLTKGKSIIIPQSEEVDSLNITIAAGVGMYAFSSITNPKK